MGAHGGAGGATRAYEWAHASPRAGASVESSLPSSLTLVVICLADSWWLWGGWRRAWWRAWAAGVGGGRGGKRRWRLVDDEDCELVIPRELNQALCLLPKGAQPSGVHRLLHGEARMPKVECD